jgi:predicted nuclease with TOPRIM domain
MLEKNKMSKIPDVDNKPKYNKNNPFRWVDSQWEKFMNRQKEDAEYIENLEGGISEMEKRIVELEMENAELKDKLNNLGENYGL